MFTVNDIVVFKNATKFGHQEFKIIDVLDTVVQLDNYEFIPSFLLVLV